MPRVGRSLAGLFTIGGAFLINAFASTYATAASESLAVRVLVIAALVVVNVGSTTGFALLTPKVIRTRAPAPGAIAGAVVFTLLITVGTGLVTHQLKNASNTYGTFGSVIGVVLFLLLLSKFSIYAAELNPVLGRRCTLGLDRGAHRSRPAGQRGAGPAGPAAYRRSDRVPLPTGQGIGGASRGRRGCARGRRPAVTGRRRRPAWPRRRPGPRPA